MKFIMHGITNLVIKFKWLIIVIWVAAALIIFAVAPNLSAILMTDNSSFLPEDSKTFRASALIKSIYPDNDNSTSFVLVISRDIKLTKQDDLFIKNLDKFFKEKKNEYFISKVMSPFTNEALKEEFISKDGKVALMSLNVSAAAFSDSATQALIEVKNTIALKTLKLNDGTSFNVPDALQMQVTGDAAINAERHKTTKDSMDLVTKITIVLLLLILLLIYRTPIAPLLPLFTIGVSLLISRGIIGYLTMVGFKVSTFTETFLIAVLFGAGTDYCMLIISRFKEELSHGVSKNQALLNSMPSTSEAIISSGGTVIIGFLFMIFAKFGLFNTTGPSVAIGIFIAILAVVTLIPALIAVLGRYVFWPMKDFSGHKDQLHGGFWSKLATFVTARPIRFLLISLICFLPLILSSIGINTSYDAMKDLPAGSSSIKGFTIMSQHFPEGELMPIRVTIKSTKDMWDTSNLKILDMVVEDLLKVDNVDYVRSASRPIGKKLTQTSLSKQISMLSSGIKKVNDGFTPINDGLKKIQKNIDKIESGIYAGSDALSSEIAEAVEQLGDGATLSADALSEINKGALSSIVGINTLKKSLGDLATAALQTKTGYDQILASINSSITSLDKLLASQPTLQSNSDFQTAYQTLKGVTTNFAPLQTGLTQINGGIKEATTGLDQISSGLSSSQGGISKTSKGVKDLAGGIKDIKSGIQLISDKFNLAASGLGSISDAFNPLNKGVDGMSSGLQKIIDAASKYSGSEGIGDAFFLPKDVFKKYPEFKKAVGNYISSNGHGSTMDIVLNVTPYSTKALDSIKSIEKTVAFSLKGTALEKSEFAVSGITAAYDEIRDFISRDMLIVMVFVLIGIFLVLALLLRSLIAPFYLLMTIILSYISTMGVTYLLFVQILGQDGLHWSVQFFSFCVLVALGVDYNIFLMTRVKEEYIPGQMRQSVTRALATTGGIITSCGLIMAGTFGAMLSSPLRPMVQIGFAACFGLIVDTFIIRSIVVPAIAVIVGEMNWWPGRRVKIQSFKRKDPKGLE